MKQKKQPNSNAGSGHRNIPYFLRILLGLYALWLTAGAGFTNEFHIYRAQYYARQAGISNLHYIPARTSAAVHFGWFARETISIIRNLIIGNLFHI